MTGQGIDMLSLVYTSSASQPLRETALEQLLTQCRRNNAEADVTGMLLYRDGRFIQVLEGLADTVRELVERIRRDPRHHDMRVLLEERVPRRRFPDWTMGYRALRGGDDTVPAGYRDSFSDLETDSDEDTARRALAELTLWFRVRSAASVDA
ncbi:BLUF domain-containing protein [Microbacterium hydrocarbonoxydans]|uniref:BLUF domain-containing protein n=1 Tax=Microbacterium hydrocarbonoxydans TaxID=273678 RepID=UPI00203F3187|nr:BLUF domain-containing protein [Microbacterium hydrocarbonoxydans]MCM3780416.1 BLUF domain-containing protein [Microbacterium hydrocarbonoxydans]